jgi:hexosaminidase
VPYLRIQDRAEFAWRGLSLDTVRAFVDVAEVKRIIDLLALYKFNVLHLHLSDNEGWRIQLKSWPKLTPTGPDGRREFYTSDEFTEIIHYAHERFITVIPEIDMPGHVGAALRAYPELADPNSRLDGPFPLAWLDTDSPTTHRFVEDVLTELAAMTDGPYLHIGGDEAFGMPADAHAAFITRTVRLVRRLNKRAVAWQEASRGDVGPKETIQHWIDFAVPATAQHQAANPEGEDGSPAAHVTPTIPSGIPADLLALLKETFIAASADSARTAAKGARVIASPTGHAYLDRPHAELSRNPSQNSVRARLGLAHYPPTPIAAYVDWNPRHAVAAELSEQLIGVEAAVWCETVTSTAELEMLLLPRLTGIAEVAWTAPTSDRDLASYRNRLAQHALLWDNAGWAWYETATVSFPDREEPLQ